MTTPGIPATTPDTPAPEQDDLLADARGLLPGIVAVRRTLHRAPELGLHLPRTQRTVLDALEGLPLAISKGKGLTSVTAVLDGARPGRTILLRADMDALPQHEDTGLEFSSEVPGAMHACGHDAHTAMLVGAARLLAARRERLAGRVVFMFQPGEESGGGARHMIDEGVLGDEPAAVDGAFALHISSRQDSGTLGLRPGPALASADLVRLTVHGGGGHASAPHLALDPIPVACEIVQALQTMITRTVSVFDPAVLTITRIQAGTTTNIIPETAELLGTLRTLTPDTRSTVRGRIARLAEHIAAAHGATVDIDLTEGYPPLVNDAGFTTLATETATALLGAERVHHVADPVMGAEDFSYVLERVPGTMAFLGARPPGRTPEQTPDLHSNRVVFDEDALATGAAVHAAVAQAFFAQSGHPK
ncbi:M20 metallopeptidase family protein [Streptomyces sp. NBC_01304]|uniref:M20 metallopeptidase family protein n=1 Tax=Streptomyces sp. NBC_01304 TaxID=2903818 RepID=UPI002E113933|nr:M20 family metallopeptidase [Streptomyces sp. NBC_01304]